MKICWDNLEKLRLNSKGNLVVGKTIYIEKDRCKQCDKPYLTVKNKVSEYCCLACTKIGKSRPKEVCEKMSKTRIARGSSKGKRNPMFAKKFSDEHRQNISNALKNKYSGKKAYWYGKTLSKEHRKKVSKSRRGLLLGPDNPNWKGGISCEPYCSAWFDKEYKESIRKRDGGVCLNPYCNNNSECICIHHIDYNKKNCKPSNLITLCNSCNASANFNRKWHKAWYKAIIYRRYGGK